MRRGVSDLIGFTLMFSVIIIGVALVATAGFGQLSEISDQEKISAAERGMEAFAADLDDISRQGDLGRSIQLAPSGGLIWYRPSTISVTAGGTTRDYDVNSLEHRFSREDGFVSVNYETGAVTRSNGGLPIVSPRMRCTPSQNSATITLLNLTGDRGLSLGTGYGSGTGVPNPPAGDEIPGETELVSTERTVTFQATHNETSVEYRTVDGPSGPITIDVSNTANPDQWGFAFEEARGWTATGTPSEFECQNVETAVVRVVDVSVTASP